MNGKTLFISCLFVLAVLASSCTPSTTDQAGAPKPPLSTSGSAAPLPTNPPAASQTPASPTDTTLPTTTPSPTETPQPSDTPTITPTFSPDTLTFAAGEPIKIGYLLFESNPIGLDSLRGVEIAIQDFGEILGHPIELTGFDDECSALGGQRGAQLLALDDSVVAIIGPNCSSAALRGAPIISDAGKVAISPSSTHPDLTAPNARAAGFFRTSPNDIFALNAVADYAFNQLGVHKMASIYENAKRLELRSGYLCQSFSALGGECVLEKPISSDATYMVPAVNDIVASGADVIHLTHFSPKVAAAFIAEVRKTQGLEKVPIFLFEGLNTPDLLKEAGEDAVGVFVSTTSMEFDRETDAYQNLLNLYRAEYGEEPLSDFHAFAYDAAAILLDAISRVAVQAEDGSLLIDPLDVRAAIASLAGFPGVTGALTCTPDGDCSAVTGGRIYQFTDGDPSTFKPGPADKLSSNPSQVWP